MKILNNILRGVVVICISLLWIGAEIKGLEKITGDPKKGKVIYDAYCIVCHGVKGDGKGPAGVSLIPRPTDFTNTEYMSSLSDLHILTGIKKGGLAVGKSPLMTAWDALLDEQKIQDVAAFIRKLSQGKE